MIATYVGGGGEGVLVHNSTDLSIPDATQTLLTFNTEDYDDNGMHSTVTNTGRLTCVTTGRYLAHFTCQFANDPTGNRYVGLFKNGTTPLDYDVKTAVNGLTTSMKVSAVVNLTAADYVTVEAYQNSGGTLAISAVAAYTAYFSLQQLP